MRIDVLLKRQLNSEGSGRSKNGGISRRFSEGLQRVALGSTFGDFCDFGGPIGFQKGSILGPKGNLFRGVILGLISSELLGGVGGIGEASGEGEFLLREGLRRL